jgi:hypothetical protein
MNKKLNGNSRAGMFPAKVSTLAFALVSAAVTAHAQFLGPANPGFENGSASWFQGGTGGAAGSVSYANSPTNGPSAPGTNCVLETSDGTGNVDFRANYFSLGMASQGTNPVTFSFDYQILGPVASGDRIRVGLRFGNATGGFLSEHNFYVGTPNGDVGGDGWQHFTGTATASSASLTADIRVSMNAFGGDDHWTSGPVLFDNFSVVADAPPTVTQPTVSPATNVAAPTTLILQVTAQGAPPIGNQWRKNAVPLADGTAGSGSVLSGSLSNMLVISNTHTSDSGSYDVVVTNSFGSVTSAVAVVTVSAQLFPPSITSIVSDPVNGTNDLHTGVNPMTITVTAQGTGPLAYQWRNNGGNLLNQTNAVLSIPNALTNSGSYTVVVSNSVASITSSSPTVITVVDSAPIALTLIGGTNISTLINTVFVDPGYTVTDDYGSPVTVTVTGTVNTNACGGYMLTYTARDLLGNTNIMSRTVNVCLVADSFNESSLANAAVSKAPGWSASAIWLSDGMLHDFTYQTDGLDPHLTPNVGDPGALAGSTSTWETLPRMLAASCGRTPP